MAFLGSCEALLLSTFHHLESFAWCFIVEADRRGPPRPGFQDGFALISQSLMVFRSTLNRKLMGSLRTGTRCLVLREVSLALVGESS